MYVNATQEPWNKHYQMYTYITEELYQLVQTNFPVIQDKISITGHRLVCLNVNEISFENRLICYFTNKYSLFVQDHL